MPEIGFVLEQTLGHVTHHRNLESRVADDPSICPHWLPIFPEQNDLWQRLPFVRGNWSLQASLRARCALRESGRQHRLDALFLHTQTVALFAVPYMKRIPTVISLDATPRNFDTVGTAYGHNTDGNIWVDRAKDSWTRRTLQAARTLVAWSRWARDSLVRDYDIPSERVLVIPPGVDLTVWRFPSRPTAPQEKLRLLFVGGDFTRKGGELVHAVFCSGLQETCTLDIVTRETEAVRGLADTPGLRTHLGLRPNSPELRRLYAEADLFVFPTLADCLPIALMEAMAAGLPIVATDTGAISEEVESGVNGLLVPARDAGALAQAVRTLVSDPVRRCAMGVAGRRLAEDRFDARCNYGALLTALKGLVTT